ncbi:MAG: DinB family protein [Actinomycetota bacterium]|nr:DinB family protein [Actinomycetota bacterium]
MITDVSSFLRYLQGVHRRTVRDVSDLPAEAETWKPSTSHDEESSWGVPQIVRHVAEARLFFAGAYAGGGWVWEECPEPVDRRSWIPALESSLARTATTLDDAPDERLRTKVEPLGEGRMVSGWRLLLMMVEHEVHHRSQIATYAGLNGWPVHQTFDLTNEWVVAQRDDELRKARQRQGS